MDLDDFTIIGDDLMPLETPILKVSRPVAACLRCRSAKIRCDGKLPACTSCERVGRAAECISTNDEFARGKERSYVSTLETRIEKLQARLEEARTRKPSVVSVTEEDTSVPPPTQPSQPSQDRVSTPTPATTKASRRKEDSAIDDLVSDFGFLSVSATARDFSGFRSALSYARLIIWACTREPLPEGTTKALPPRHTTTSLLERYLSVAHQLIPVIDESTIYLAVNKVYDQSKAEPLDHWMVRLVLAISCASWSERSGDQYYMDAIGHVCAALVYSEAVLRPGSISSVQALVLLVKYALLDPHHFDAWSLVGVASRAMVDLGLHQDPPKGAPMTKGKLDSRRRVFWSIYVLDRSTSLVQSRAFSFSDDSAKVKVPFAKHPSSATASSPAASDSSKSWLKSHDQALDLIVLRGLQSSWYTDLFQSGRDAWEEPYTIIWSMCEDMRKWFDGLSASTPPHMRTYFELELLYSYVYVLAPSPRVPTIASYAQTLIFEYCIRYADMLHGVLDMAGSMAPVNFNDASRAYMTGRNFLDILQQNADGLLSGVIPPRPDVRPSAPPPPRLPDVSYPPGDQLAYFNTVRAISCIRKLEDCLLRFCQRWGYHSWSKDFSAATTPMVEQLVGRQRTFEAMAAGRTPSIWHSTNHGSVSSNGSVSHSRSAANSVSAHSGTYGSISAPAVQPASLFRTPSSNMTSSPPQQLSPPANYQPQLWQHNGSLPALYQHSAHSSISGTFPVQPMSSADGGSAYIDSSANFSGTNVAAAPHQQFNAWGGYTAPHVPDTLDEENAIPPASTWQQYPR